ncbi:MAG TPA: DUF1326 domain-containing protein [Thermoplasmata archaeon]|nr:DUF1326 domain-containing protein [Thermoplasmata archaeon]
MPETWTLSGDYFESCNCDVACPCVFMSAPSSGDCRLLLAWRITHGKYGKVPLDGLNVALAVHAPGPMLKTKWDVALYLDERATRAQQDALGTIFGGRAGGEPAALGPFVGKVLGVKAARIDLEVRGKRRRLRIPRLAEMDIEALKGQGGKDVTLENVPFIAVPNQTVIVAKSKKLSYHDHGLDWELSEKNGYYCPFSFKGP